MSTPTIGELKRRIEDLEACAEEWDERMGLADGESDGSGPEITGREWEIKWDGDATTIPGELIEVSFQRNDEEDEETRVVDDETRAFDSPTHTFNCGGYAHEGKLVAQVGGLEAFRDGDGDYWLTSSNIRKGLQKGYLLGATADNLRLLADKIEEAER